MLDLRSLDTEEIATALADQTDYKHRWLIKRHTYLTNMLFSGLSLPDVQIPASHADPTHHQPCATTAPARTSLSTW